MQFLARVLRLDESFADLARFLLMLTEVPEGGHWEARRLVEGFHMGYGSVDALVAALRQANLNSELIDQLRNDLDLGSRFALVGLLTLDSQQLNQLGFQALGRVLDVS